LISFCTFGDYKFLNFYFCRLHPLLLG
jgi:hypothetical protein